MGTMKPQAQLLTIWRLTLAAAMCVPAFLNSLFLRVTNPVWLWTTLGWLAVFLILYLVYLPLCYRAVSFSVTADHVLLYKGVLYTRSLTVPLAGIQFVSLSSSPLEKLFGLRSVVVVVPGGRLVLPGLRTQDAERLSAALGDVQ